MSGNAGLLWLARRETLRVSKLWTQTVLAPVISSTLFIVVFGLSLGGRIKQVHGFDYEVFIVPGLVTMAMVQAAYSNNSSSIFQARFDRYLNDMLAAPMRNWEVNLGFSLGGAIRALAIGAGLLALAIPVTGVPIERPVALVVADVTRPDQVERVFADVTARAAPTILVNNAGAAESAPFGRTDLGLWQRMLDLNLTGAFLCTRQALPPMLAAGYGRVVNVASIAGKTGAPYIAAYSASKHGVLGLTRSVALEAALKGVTVNAICPGYVETEMTERAVRTITTKTGKTTDEALDAIKRMSPQNRLVTPDEVAALALLLASEEGRGINGQAINVDGGSVLY